MKVPIPPYRPYAVLSFYNILKFSARVLRDCIKLMQLELVSGGDGTISVFTRASQCLLLILINHYTFEVTVCIALQNPSPQLQQQMKWNIQWCLTNPPIGYPIAPPGLQIVVVSRSKILLFVSVI